MSGRLTHLSLHGLGTALGQSQVLAVSERLQSLGWDCRILSLEPPDLGEIVLAQVASRIARSGIRWEHRPYRRGRSGVVHNVWSMAAMLGDVRGRTDLVHCRSYFGAFFSSFADVLGGAPYVFDTRGYWVDEKIEDGRWFQDAATRALARRVEQELYNRASGVVCLTELAAEDVRRGRFGKRHAPSRSICIPTCADYGKFKIEKRTAPHDFLREGPIIAYVGSLNPSYEYRKSLQLASLILERDPNAKFLALTAQIEDLTSLAEELAIPRDRRLITSVAHDRIHLWLPWIDFGLMLLVGPNQAKRASMPTKLAEFLATGVAPIAHGANSEVTNWVERAGSGIVLDDLSTSSLGRAVSFVEKGVPDTGILERARLVAEGHFSLDSGAERYDQLFRDILS